MTKRIALFDVDGTLAVPRQSATAEMLEFLQQLRQKLPVGIVGGSDLSKIREQLGAETEHLYDYVFAENGLDAFENGSSIAKQSIKEHLGEKKLQAFINFVLRYIADLEIPIKRGTFIEFRNGMLNVSPIGRNCSQQERDEFEKFDKEAKVRATMVQALQKQFSEYGLKFSIGGQISFDVFPIGWDKTYCLRFLKDFDEIHFFGDKTYEGGNDYEIFVSERTIGHSVQSPVETMEICQKLFMLPA